MKNNLINIAKKSALAQINELKKIKSVFNKSFIKSIEHYIQLQRKSYNRRNWKKWNYSKKNFSYFFIGRCTIFFLSPDFNHGDLGQIEKKDILLIFSYSGNTAELNNLLRYANRFNIKIIGVASKKDSLLLKASDVKILIPKVKEADPTKMVPTTSTSITLLFGDCLAIALMHKKKFSKERFKVFHPGGNIGQLFHLLKTL